MNCEIHGCDIPATHAWDWPGQGLRASCFAHAMKARHIADTLGFGLSIGSPEPRIKMLAGEAAARLAGVELCGHGSPIEKLRCAFCAKFGAM